MNLYSAWCRLTILFLCFLLVLMTTESQAHPIGNPEHALENMRQIPQWHCLRYRRFDLVKRCRNYRYEFVGTMKCIRVVVEDIFMLAVYKWHRLQPAMSLPNRTNYTAFRLWPWAHLTKQSSFGSGRKARY